MTVENKLVAKILSRLMVNTTESLRDIAEKTANVENQYNKENLENMLIQLEST